MRVPLVRGFCLALGITCVIQTCAAQPPAAQPDVGPKTEHRFPPLKIPAGFKATLFACDPLVEYPSVIALGPRARTLFVAHDYVTGLGVEIVRRDEIRLLEDTDSDGYADRSNVFARGFNSVQGLAFYDNTVFVMHAPLLTSLRDTNGDGVSDERRDLLDGLGLPPEENSNRLHCANGVVAGHDGWLYLALGDRGCDVMRPEGDRLVFQQGGILRCRSDGSDLHVFATGLRNIYDVALDAELNVFVRDNENDGGNYMVRVCHCFFGSDHGYPYHYYERPDEPLQPLADLGRGSSAGGTSYLETVFPQEYRESLFFCEWGRGVVRYRRANQGSSFEPMREIDFVIGAEDDPYGFKPTDLVVDRDGSLLVSDWADGQRPKRGRGRIYRISALTGEKAAPTKSGRDLEQLDLEQLDLAELVRRLDSASYHGRVAAQLVLQKRGAPATRAVVAAIKSKNLQTRGRLHAVWIIAQSGADSALDDLFELAKSDPAAGVRAQAVRAIGDLTDPVLVHRELDAGRGDHKIGTRIAQSVEDADPRVALEALAAFRRLHWCQAPEWIGEHLAAGDPALDHAAQQALRHARNWPAVMRLLAASPRLRKLALHATAEQRVPYLATTFIRRLTTASNPAHRREYADALARIVRREKPWTYWGFRPAPRPAATIEWEKTAEIVNALNEILADESHDVRTFALERMRREGVTPDISRLVNWLREETNEGRVESILAALKSASAQETRPILREVLLRRSLPVANRLTALSALVADLPLDETGKLLEFGRRLEDGPVLSAVLRELGKRPKLNATDLLLAKLESASAATRAAAIRSLGERGCLEAREHVVRLLDDEDIAVRQAAVEAAGLLEAGQAVDELIRLSSDHEKGLVQASLVSLRQLGDARALAPAVVALRHTATQLAALRYLRTFGSPELVDEIIETAATNPAADFQREAVATLRAWAEKFPGEAHQIAQALGKIQGRSGQLLLWQTTGPITDAEADRIREQLRGHDSLAHGLNDRKFETLMADAADASVPVKLSGAEQVWLAWSLVAVPEQTEIEVLTSAAGGLSVWLGATRVHRRAQPQPYRPDSDRFSTQLAAGMRLVAVEVRPGREASRFHLRFRRRSSKAEHERLSQFALQTRGNANRGRETFENVKKSTCLQCHRLGEQGGKIGPDLAGIGSRFSRIHLIEAILEPSRTVAPSYATVAVVLNSGRVLTGVRISEDTDSLLLGDNQGKAHEISRADIDEMVPQNGSTMPAGLEKKLTDREFVDLLAFLESQKNRSD